MNRVVIVLTNEYSLVQNPPIKSINGIPVVWALAPEDYSLIDTEIEVLNVMGGENLLVFAPGVQCKEASVAKAKLVGPVFDHFKQLMSTIH